MSTGLHVAATGRVRAPPLTVTPPLVVVPREGRAEKSDVPPPTTRTLRPRRGGGTSVIGVRRTPSPPTITAMATTIGSSDGGSGEGDERRDASSSASDGSWSVARRRTARRRAPRAVAGPPTGGVEGVGVRAAPLPPPVTAANYPPLPAAGGAIRRHRGVGTPPEQRPEDAPVRAGVRNAAHPGALGDVRGVMGRRRPPAAGAVARPANDVGRGGRPPGARRNPAIVAGPAQGVPAAAPGVDRRPARQRAAERRRLVAVAESVATREDLEDLARELVQFFGGDARGGPPPRPRGRPVRREVVREGARGDAGAPREERGRDMAREAARIQALFRKNRRKAIREVLAGRAESCDVPTQRVQRYFEDLHNARENLEGVAAVELPDASQDAQNGAGLAHPFSEREVDRRLRRMNNSAPGPDGITYRDLRVADAGAQLLCATYNACLRLEAVPSAWKTSNTVLVYKKGDSDDLRNWRPLALGDTIPKLFAAVLADRLTDWAVANRKLSPSQKGFLRDEGCYEHNFVLQEILTEARRERSEVMVAWLDLSNAFGSVPHSTIHRALVRAGVHRSLIALWGSMYNGCTTRVRTVDGYTAPIPVRRGVRQGCPLSPVVFDLAVDSVLRAVSDVGGGVGLHGSRWAVMAYADDLVLVSRSPANMKQLLQVAEEEALSVGLRFNPAKCATLHIGGGRGGGVLPTTLRIQGQPVRPLADGEAYVHLGIPTGSSVNQTPLAAMQALNEDLCAVDRSLLAPWQKSEAVATFLLPRMDFLLRGAHVEKRPLKTVDLNIRRMVKRWLSLPQRASAEVVHIPPRRGGCGLLPMADLADVLTIAHVFRLLTADDRAIRDLAWASLRGVVHRRIGHPPSCDDIAAFLSGSLEGRLRGGGESSLWSRARNAARRQSERCAIRWRWLGDRDELVLECRGPGGRTTKIPPGARTQVIGRLRAAVAEWYMHTLLRKPDQGKVYEVSSRERVSNHFLRGGSFTRFADWRFVHRARLDVLPLNGARRWGDGDRRCRRCGEAAETLPHVIGHCGPHSAAIQWRHDSVLLRLKRACRLPGTVTVNQRVEGLDGELGALRPDLVIRHEPSKSVVICDVTVPFENRLVAFEEARARKVAKYSPLAEALSQKGYRVVVTALVVGALGSWDPRNESVLRLLRVGKTYGSMMRRLIVSDTIRWSRDIYVEHVSGVRQYEAPPRNADGGLPDVPPPLAVRRRVTIARADDEMVNNGFARENVA